MFRYPFFIFLILASNEDEEDEDMLSDVDNDFPSSIEENLNMKIREVIERENENEEKGKGNDLREKDGSSEEDLERDKWICHLCTWKNNGSFVLVVFFLSLSLFF